MTKDQAVAILEAERALKLIRRNPVTPNGPDSAHGTSWNGYVREASRAISGDPALIREFADLHLCVCKRCGDFLDDHGYCADVACPHSDYLQWEEYDG